MRGHTGSRYKNVRRRVRPLRPWIIGLNVPNVVNELSDVKPFIYLCCKISITEQSWTNIPESPKALIVKDADSLRLCDGQFWIDLNADKGPQELLICKNKFRNRDVCFFIVFLDEYLINYDSKSRTFVASVKDIRIVYDTHCLSEAFSSIPSIKSAEKDLLSAVLSPLSRGTVLNKSSSRSSSEDGECKNSSEKSGSGVKMMDVEPRPVSVTIENIPFSGTNISIEESGLDAKEEINEASPPTLEQPSIFPPEQSSGADKWIPTQNPSGETLSFGDNIDTVSVDDESDNIATSDQVPPLKTASDDAIDERDPSVGRDLFCISDLSPSNSCKNKLSAGRHNVDLDCSNTSVHTPHTSKSNSLYHSNSPLSTPPYSPPSYSPQPPPELRANFLTWLSTQEPTVEICYLERTARAIEELRKIEPEHPFSDYFINFAFIE